MWLIQTIIEMKKRLSMIVVVVIALAVAVPRHRTQKQTGSFSKTCQHKCHDMAPDIELMRGELVLWWINNH
jgi:hypothetical protein